MLPTNKYVLHLLHVYNNLSNIAVREVVLQQMCCVMIKANHSPSGIDGITHCLMWRESMNSH